jgi:hypothetical protein
VNRPALLLALAATAFHLLAVVPWCPHGEAWALHAGCLLALVAFWWAAVRASRWGLGLALVAAAVIGAGLMDIARIEQSMSDELTGLAYQRVRFARRSATPGFDEIVAIARDRRKGWGRASLRGLAALGDPHATVYTDAGEWPGVYHADYRRFLGMDRLGLLKAGLEVEKACRRSADNARARLLAIVDAR